MGLYRLVRRCRLCRSRAALRVGMGSLNPAVVTVITNQGEPGMSIGRLRAAGREGLIKQHPASKALAKITPLLLAT